MLLKIYYMEFEVFEREHTFSNLLSVCVTVVFKHKVVVTRSAVEESGVVLSVARSVSLRACFRVCRAVFPLAPHESSQRMLYCNDAMIQSEVVLVIGVAVPRQNTELAFGNVEVELHHRGAA